jgi:integrase
MKRGADVAHSNKASGARKPHPNFPLTPRGDGRWCKKIRGQFHYFAGTAQEALDEWNRIKDDLLAGHEPGAKCDGLTVGDLCTKFLLSKRELLENGEIAPRTWDDSKVITDRIVETFGKTKQVKGLRNSDFERLCKKLAERLGVVALGNAVQRVRSVFKYAKDAELVDQEVSFGPGFKRPSKKSLRLARAAKGPRLFEAADLRKLIEAADTQLKAMILLAINGGMGNSDIAALHTRAIDLDSGWINFPRPKTGIERRIPIWPETAAAVREVLASRPKAKDKADADLVFITKYGHSWAKLGSYEFDDTAPLTEGKKTPRKRVSSNNSLSKEFKKLTTEAGVNRTFYDLRHTFATIGGEGKDQVALGSIMGHANESMAAVYRERISDERLRAVVDHVRCWLFGAEAKSGDAGALKQAKAASKSKVHREQPAVAGKRKATAEVLTERFALRVVG